MSSHDRVPGYWDAYDWTELDERPTAAELDAEVPDDGTYPPRARDRADRQAANRAVWDNPHAGYAALDKVARERAYARTFERTRDPQFAPDIDEPARYDTETTCHCGALYLGCDHCPACGCEQYETIVVRDCGHVEPDPLSAANAVRGDIVRNIVTGQTGKVVGASQFGRISVRVASGAVLRWERTSAVLLPC
jgi:hypothetical protein